MTKANPNLAARIVPALALGLALGLSSIGSIAMANETAQPVLTTKDAVKTTPKWNVGDLRITIPGLF